MDDIAKEAGLAKATLYPHFRGKDDVFRAMLRLLAKRDQIRCREVMAMDGPFATRLSLLLHTHYGQAYASFGTGEHLVELKAVMASIAGPELQTFDQIFVDFAKRLFVTAGKAGRDQAGKERRRPRSADREPHARGRRREGGEPPSRETYAERLTSIAKIICRGGGTLTLRAGRRHDSMRGWSRIGLQAWSTTARSSSTAA